MPITYVSGDPLLTRAQTLAFGHNVTGRTELGLLETRLLQQFPAAFATYGKQCRGGRIKTGSLWMWRESTPLLGFMVVRESSVGATRLRYIDSIALQIAREYRLFGLTSLAIAPLTGKEEWPSIKPVFEQWLAKCPLPVVIYERYEAGVFGEQG
jgi:hypothetical protein